MGTYVDYYFENNRLKNMVDHIIKKKFGWLPQKDYDDFYSMAGQTLWYCEEHFDKNKQGDFYKYLTDSLYRKAKTQITWNNRKKRRGDVPDVSIYTLIDNENDITIGDTLAQKEDNDIDVLVERYLDSLTKKQRQVAELMMQGCSDKDIKSMLGISNEQYGVIVMNMKKPEKTTPLKTLKERMRYKCLL